MDTAGCVVPSCVASDGVGRSARRELQDYRHLCGGMVGSGYQVCALIYLLTRIGFFGSFADKCIEFTGLNWS